MANLSSLSKFMQLAKLVNNKSINFRSIYRSLSFAHQSNYMPPADYKARHSSQVISQIKVQTSHHRHFCSKTPNDPVKPGLDEFREREQKREEEFEEREREKIRESSDDSNDTKVNAIRIKILEAALPHVPTSGWTRETIILGAEEIGFSGVAHGMFPEGGFALVSYFIGKCNEELLTQMKTETENGRKAVHNHIEFLVKFVRIRLEMILPYKNQWAQAIALIALPQNAATSLAQLLTLVDDICYYSGDRSVDIEWYTRRIGLATVMKMTELYMLQDKSPQHTNTWVFLENRMDEFGQLQIIFSQTEDVTQTFKNSLNSAFITARNILGLGYNRP
ncbi:ubiquinone biosynthesis protein COQ9, mitochondrial [Glossina fuscipes]|uniref:Ubiquinone biosynthesis protein n=1 Tax=Glossina fuscipes TaxID=7396 RepID=A0A9C5YWP1_9MUSC|nr:ubiquinone biosynthesis protein COQ9, mitochondrial [Glossina fuscipes]